MPDVPLVSASAGSQETDRTAFLLKLVILQVVQTCDVVFFPHAIMLWRGITDLHPLCHIFSTFATLFTDPRGSNLTFTKLQLTPTNYYCEKKRQTFLKNTFLIVSFGKRKDKP